MNIQESEKETTVLEPSTALSDRLREATHPVHATLDRSIMVAKPFESVENYGRFLRVQHGVHRDVASLYRSEALGDIFPKLRQYGRLEAVERDLADLGQAVPAYDEAPAMSTTARLDIPEALGWLYVVEGSNLGAAFLLKYARKMGLSESRGARHLGEPPEGRAPRWKAFKQSLNAVALSDMEETCAIAAAETAFGRVETLVRRHLS